MYKVQYYFLALYFLGIIFKLIHFPFSSEILLLATIIFVVSSVIYFLKHIRFQYFASFANLSCAFSMIYFLFRVQFWPMGGQLLFLITLLLDLIAVLMYFILKVNNKLILVGLFLVTFSVCSLFFTASHKIYYFLHLNEWTNSEGIEKDFIAWDKYSWFLNCAKKYDESLAANKQAQKIVKKAFLEDSNNKVTLDYLLIIQQHEQKIKENNWLSY